MAAYTDSLGFTKGTAAFPAKNNDVVSLVSVELDFAAITAARAAAGATALVATDSLDVLPIPPGASVLATGVQVIKAQGAECTAGIGDSGSATRFLTATDLNVVGSSAAAAAATPYFYAAANALRVTLGHTTNAAVVRVWALMADTTN